MGSVPASDPLHAVIVSLVARFVARKHARTRARAHTHTHMHIHIHIHMRARTHARTHARTFCDCHGHMREHTHTKQKKSERHGRKTWHDHAMNVSITNTNRAYLEVDKHGLPEADNSVYLRFDQRGLYSEAGQPGLFFF